MGTPSSGGSSSSAEMMNMMVRSPFTVLQWQELEHQALIFKYMLVGLPVPPQLVVPIQKSLEYSSHGFLTHPTSNKLGYCSYYGKKMDPEPGRCRRTDGKKWRCSKDAYPDSKYCERHMNRGRNRSRKPVESHTMTQSVLSMTSLTSSGGNGSFQSLPLHGFGKVLTTGHTTSQSQYQVDSIPYAIPSKDYRNLEGFKNKSSEHSLFLQASASNKSLEMDAALDNGWPLASSRMSSFQPSNPSESSLLQNEYPQHSFYSGEFASSGAEKQECQPLRPFFDEWPKSRDNWSCLEEERLDETSFSTTKLSISVPMTSDFSAANSQLQHGNLERSSSGYLQDIYP